MSTWTSKGLGAALLCAAAFSLAGCDAGAGLPVASPGGGGGLTLGAAAPPTALALAGGAVTLAAPSGYCFDRRSVKRTPRGGFAVLARCDTLGAQGSFAGYDLALITVAVMPRAAEARAPDPAAVARTAGNVKVLDRRSAGPVALVRLADGPHEMAGVARVHWRAAFAAPGHLVGLGLYAPEGSSVLGAQGRLLLQEMAEKTLAASAAARRARAE